MGGGSSRDTLSLPGLDKYLRSIRGILDEMGVKVVKAEAFRNCLNSPGAVTGAVFSGILTFGILNAVHGRPYHWALVLTLSDPAGGPTRYLSISFEHYNDVTISLHDTKAEAIAAGRRFVNIPENGDDFPSIAMPSLTVTRTVSLNRVLALFEHTLPRREYNFVSYNCHHFVEDFLFYFKKL